jgi:hypothetical protein
LCLLACGLLAISATASDSSDSSIRTQAVLVTPHDVLISWTDPVPGAAGHTVEWTMSPDHDYTILQFVPDGTNTYTHPRLMSEMNCYYRVRAYYGPASEAQSVALPEKLSDREFAERFAKPENFEWAGPVRVAEKEATAKASLRAEPVAEAARPLNFRIALVPTTVSGFKMTWTDRSSDADGQMIEMKPQGSAGYIIRALVAPGINSFGWSLAPPDRQTWVRIRPFYYGSPSNVVYLKTGPERSGTSVASLR